jgi:hypothetical protein
VEGRRRTKNLEGFKLRKILEEIAQNSASVEEGQEQSKSREKKVISVIKEEGLSEFLKEVRIVHRWEEIGGKISGDLGVGALGGLPRENRNLREVVKSGLNPDHCIWKGHMEVIHIFRRSRFIKDIRGG